jgi:hypothetical protein
MTYQKCSKNLGQLGRCSACSSQILPLNPYFVIAVVQRCALYPELVHWDHDGPSDVHEHGPTYGNHRWWSDGRPDLHRGQLPVRDDRWMSARALLSTGQDE